MTSFKEKARIFYITKGSIEHVPASTIEECYDGFVARLWGNTDIGMREEGFEAAYKKYTKSAHWLCTRS